MNERKKTIQQTAIDKCLAANQYRQQNTDIFFPSNFSPRLENQIKAFFPIRYRIANNKQQAHTKDNS